MLAFKGVVPEYPQVPSKETPFDASFTRIHTSQELARLVPAWYLHELPNTVQFMCSYVSARLCSLDL